MTEYYMTCPIPKPVDKKKKKPCNGYKDKRNRVCAYCGEHYAERHEVFGGSLRLTSIANKFQVDVCQAHHRELQDNCSDWAQAENQRLREGFEKEYIKSLEERGMSEKTALSAWMQLIGKNYCDEYMPE